MFSLPLIRVAAASLLGGAVMILASTATAQAPVPPGVGNPGAGQAGGKGIGPMVHALATSGVHGQQLAAAILGLQAAKGIAKGRVGLAAGGKQFPGGNIPKQGPPGGMPMGKGKGGQQAQLPIPGGQPGVPGGLPGVPIPNQPGGNPGQAGGFPGQGKGQLGRQPQFPGPGGGPMLPGGQPGGPGGLPLGKGRGGKQGLLPVPGGPGGGGMPILPGGKQGPLGGFPKGRGKAGK
jgi:translation initiation factor IF-2